MNTTLPKHRRTFPFYVDHKLFDVQNDARCTHFGEPRCTSLVCPRHRPEGYAECMARHATDSIPPAWSTES